MKVPEQIESFPSEPSIFVLWIDVEFDLANIGRHAAILKNYKIYYRMPSGWRIGLVSPGFGFEHPEPILYSIDLGTIAPGQSMHRKQQIGFDPSFASFRGELLKVNLHPLSSDQYPVVLEWKIDYLVEGKLRKKQWCWMVDYKTDLPGRCPSQPPERTRSCQ